MRKQLNYKGESVEGIKRRLLKEEYGTGKEDAYGNPEIAWKRFLLDSADEHGFDCENRESNDNYLIEMILPKGTVIIRYGDESGIYTAPKGTSYEELALPYEPETLEYNEYKVLEDSMQVYCLVKKGKVAYSVDETGGGVQYMHEKSIAKLVGQEVLDRLKLWE